MYVCEYKIKTFRPFRRDNRCLVKEFQLRSGGVPLYQLIWGSVGSEKSDTH